MAPYRGRVTDLRTLRHEYAARGLDESELTPEPLDLFGRWFDEALAAGLGEPNAMVVATVSADGRPSSRTVLLKGLSDGGFVFFTNHDSAKGRDLAAWLGLVPRQATTGRRPKLLGITKRGSRYLRKMLIQGARSAMPSLTKSNTAVGSWLRALLARTHLNVAVVALAAKMARTVWALLHHGRTYQVASK